MGKAYFKIWGPELVQRPTPSPSNSQGPLFAEVLSLPVWVGEVDR